MDVTQIVEGGIYKVKEENEAEILLVVAKINIEGQKCWGFPGFFKNSSFSYMVNDVECHWADDVISHISDVGADVLKDIKEIADEMLEEQKMFLLGHMTS